MSLFLSLVPGSTVDISLHSPTATSSQCAPQPLDVGTSEFPSAPPNQGTTHEAVCRGKPPVHHGLGRSLYKGGASSALRTLPGNHHSMWRGKAPPHHRMGSTYYYTTDTKGVAAHVVYTEMGSRSCNLDVSDPWIKFDVFMKKVPAFELIQGHQLIEDRFNAMMWDAKSQKVLKNLLGLHGHNCDHNVSVAGSFYPENILVAENSCSVKIINPVGHQIDGIHHFTSDGLKEVVNMYFTEATQNQPGVTTPLDMLIFKRKVEHLGKVLMTKEKLEEYFCDSCLLDEDGRTVALDQSSFLLRSCYVSSNLQCDIDCRHYGLLAVRNSKCRNGTDFVTYVVGTGVVPITEHFYNATITRSTGYQNLHSLAPLAHQSCLMQIQAGHDQIGSERNMVQHLNDRHNLLRFQKYINPTPAQESQIVGQEQIIDLTVTQQVIGARKQIIIPTANHQIINPTGLQQVIKPLQVISPLQQQQQQQQQPPVSPQIAKRLRTIQHDPYMPALITVSRKAMTKYSWYHFPCTTGDVFEVMRRAPKSKQDMDFPRLFYSDSKPTA